MKDRTTTYKDAGVDIKKADELKTEIKHVVSVTFRPETLSEVGLFGGLTSLADVLKRYKYPVMVQSADGLGTKFKIAKKIGRFNTVGADLVNHCINDILCQGGEPVTFFDYVASAVLGPEIVIEIIKGMTDACRAVGCSLPGGETAEMPGVYLEGEYEVAGFITGFVERDRVINGSKIGPGNLLLGLPSNGLHTNGYSLVRDVFDGVSLGHFFSELGCTLGEELLRVHRCYFDVVYPLLQKYDVKGLAHITGGGIPGNLSRIIPDGLCAEVDRLSWDIPPIFELIQKRGNVPWPDMRKTFNLGVGMIAVVPPRDYKGMLRELRGGCWVLGHIRRQEEGEEKVVYAI